MFSSGKMSHFYPGTFTFTAPFPLDEMGPTTGTSFIRNWWCYSKRLPLKYKLGISL